MIFLTLVSSVLKNFPAGRVVKNPPDNAGDTRDAGLIPGSGESPWRRKWQPTLVFLPGKSDGQRSLTGYSPQDHKELGTTEGPCACARARAHTHTHTHSQPH